jgi:hypothetical protein
MDARGRTANPFAVPNGITADIIRRHLRAHNYSVVATSGATLILSAFGWAILYIVTYWATMFVLTVKSAGAAELPAAFDLVFGVTGGLLLFSALLDAVLFPRERLIVERPALKTAIDLVLFLPRMTLSVVLNFLAWAYLPSRALPVAIGMLDLLRTRRRLALSELPLEFPDDRKRDRALRVLQLLQLTEIRPDRGQIWLRLSPLAPAVLRGPLLADDADDKLARMRRATVLEHEDPLPRPQRQLPSNDRDRL